MRGMNPLNRYRTWCMLPLLVGLLAGCASTTQGNSDAAQRQQLLLVSPQQMDRMTAQAYAQSLRQAKRQGQLNQRLDVLARVRRVANRLIPATGAFRADAPGWAWEVNVIDRPDLNAWAMHGGKMAVYTGLVDKLQLTDDELAAIMGHEMAHALREHSREAMSQALATDLTINLGVQLLGLGAGVGDMVSTGADLMLRLPNSRRAESEADRLGLELAARSGFDPRAAVSLWQKMAAQSQGKQPPAWLSTHPSHSQRVAELSALAQQLLPVYRQATSRRDPVVRRAP